MIDFFLNPKYSKMNLTIPDELNDLMDNEQLYDFISKTVCNTSEYVVSRVCYNEEYKNLFFVTCILFLIYLFAIVSGITSYFISYKNKTITNEPSASV